MAPLFECMVVIRGSLNHSELQAALLRLSKTIMSQGGVIQKMENYGNRSLPRRFKRENKGGFYLWKFVSGTQMVTKIEQEFEYDVDVLRFSTSNLEYESDVSKTRPACTLDEEIKPPPYRTELMKKFYPMKGRGDPPFYWYEP